MNIYTSIEEAGEIIRRRWADKDLKDRVEKKLNNDFPEILKNEPQGLIWRCICTPDGEFERFLCLCEKAKINPVGFEIRQDKFYSGNFTKHALTQMVFSKGLNKDSLRITLKENIIDFNSSQGKRMCDLETLWGENLADFHRFFLETVFPVMKNRVIDSSEWLKIKGGSPEKYYFYILSLAVCHVVYFDDYDTLEAEKGFIDEIILPAFREVESCFGVQPIIVRISKAGGQERDPYWWCYSEEAKEIMHNHIKKFKC